MRSYILKRLWIAVLLLLAMTFMTFLIMRATPGNFFDALKMNPQISPETVARYEHLYGLDKPLFMQYGHWLANILRGEFGYSFYYNVPVTHILVGRLGNAFILSLASFLLTWLVAIPLGVWAALRRNQLADRLLSFLSFAAFSTPGFFLAMLLLYAASQWGVLPLGGMRSPTYDDMTALAKILDVGAHLIIPTVVLSLASMASLQRLMRANLLSVLRKQYVTAARAKGLPENQVIYRHALRNAFNPMVTLLGYEFSGLLSGAALVEIVCSWPGLGTLMLTAVRAKDMYVVMASMLMGGVLLLLGNLLADILLLWVDPRIRYGSTRHE